MECRIPVEFKFSQIYDFTVVCKSGFCSKKIIHQSGLNAKAKQDLWEAYPPNSERSFGLRNNHDISRLIQSGIYKKKSIKRELTRPCSRPSTQSNGLMARSSVRFATTSEDVDSFDLNGQDSMKMKRLLMSFTKREPNNLPAESCDIDYLRRKIIIHNVPKKRESSEDYKGITKERRSLKCFAPKPPRIIPLIEILPLNIESKKDIHKPNSEGLRQSFVSDENVSDLVKKKKYAIDESSNLTSFYDYSRTDRVSIE